MDEIRTLGSLGGTRSLDRAWGHLRKRDDQFDSFTVARSKKEDSALTANSSPISVVTVFVLVDVISVGAERRVRLASDFV